MFTNYIKSVILSLWKRKWFSLLTIFSVALSLMLAISVTWFYTSQYYSHAPELNKDRTFFLSPLVKNAETGRPEPWYHARGAMGRKFYSEILKKLKTPINYTIMSQGAYREFYRNNEMYGVDDMYTDGNFFSVFDFEFVAGAPYKGVAEIKKRDVINCVISADFARYYFGSINCINQEVISYNKRYKVCGVINKPFASPNLVADFYVQFSREELEYGNWRNVAFLCASPEDKHELQSELKKISQKCSERSKKYDIELQAATSAEKVIRTYLPRDPLQIYMICFVLLLVIFVLPVLCLINVLRNNQAFGKHTIGLHKAFGASRNQVIKIMIAENLLIILMGGLLGMLISVFIPLIMIEGSTWKVYADFYNWRALLSYFLMLLFVGVISGIWPAISISKKKIVNALNERDYV